MTDSLNSTTPYINLLALKHQPFADFLSADEAYWHNEAAEVRALRIMSKLARRIGDERAYEVSGMGFLDRRGTKLYHARRTALEKLAKYRSALTFDERVLMAGRICYGLLGHGLAKWAANDRMPSRRANAD